MRVQRIFPRDVSPLIAHNARVPLQPGALFACIYEKIFCIGIHERIPRRIPRRPELREPAGKTQRAHKRRPLSKFRSIFFFFFFSSAAAVVPLQYIGTAAPPRRACVHGVRVLFFFYSAVGSVARIHSTTIGPGRFIAIIYNRSTRTLHCTHTRAQMLYNTFL